jgi:hypothetical protein
VDKEGKNIYESDEVNAVVVDVGTSSTRFGYSGDDSPVAVFPSVRYVLCHCSWSSCVNISATLPHMHTTDSFRSSMAGRRACRWWKGQGWGHGGG